MTTIAVLGASGRVGRRVVSALQEQGVHVLALSRSPLEVADAENRIVDALDAEQVGRALSGADGVVVALGISENPVRVRLRGPSGTTSDIRSRGTRNVVDAMRSQGISRLVALSTYGIGDSARHLPLSMRILVAALLRPQFADHEAQEQVVRASGLDWTLIRPVNLTAEKRPPVVVDPAMRTVSMRVGLDQVAEVIAGSVLGSASVHQTLALSS